MPAEAEQQERPAEPALWLPECEVVSVHIVTGQDTCQARGGCSLQRPASTHLTIAHSQAPLC